MKVHTRGGKRKRGEEVGEGPKEAKSTVYVE